MEFQIIELDLDETEQRFASEHCQQLIQSMKDFYPTIGFHKPWVGYFVVENQEIVGTGSFTGQPQEGSVEIAYWTFKEHEGKGIASFACKQLIAITRATDPSLIITAKTAPEKNASTKILQNNGFQFTEIVQDHEIGDAWLWILEPR